MSIEADKVVLIIPRDGVKGVASAILSSSPPVTGLINEMDIEDLVRSIFHKKQSARDEETIRPDDKKLI